MKQRSYVRSIIVILLGLALIFVGHWKNYDKVQNADLKRFQQKIQVDLHNQERDLLKYMDDTTHLRKATKYENIKEALIAKLSQEPFDLIIYNNMELVFWSTNTILAKDINRRFVSEITMAKFNNGFYEVIRRDFGEGFSVLGIIPIYKNYPINNKYLKDGFDLDVKGIEQVKFSPRIGDVVVNSINGQPLFSILSQPALNIKKNHLPLICQIIGLLIVFLGLNLMIVTLANQKKYLLALTGLVLTVVCLELVLNQLQWLKAFYNYFFFSPQLYASKAYGDSFGTLMIRAVILLWFVLFLNRSFKFLHFTKNVAAKNVVTLLLLLVFSVSFILYFFIVQSLVQHSTISFDFYNFYTLSHYSFLGLLLFSLLGTVIYVLGQNAMKWIRNFSKSERLIIFAINCVLVVLMAMFLRKVNIVFVVSIYIAFLVLLHYEFQFNKIKFYFFKYVLLLTLLAILTSYAILHNNGLQNIEFKKDYVSKLLFERNYNEEYKFGNAQLQIQNDNFIKRYFKNPYVNNINILQRVSDIHLSDFSRNFNIYVSTYNANKGSLAGSELRPFNYYSNLFDNQGLATAARTFKYIDIGDGAKQYLGIIRLENNEGILGYLVMEIIPKVYGTSSAYPELLLENQESDTKKEDQYAFAIYKNNKLIKSKGEYEFTSTLNFDSGVPNQHNYYKDKNFNHIVYTSDQGTTVILSEPKLPAIVPVSIFSYVFCFFLIYMVLASVFGLKNAITGNEEYKVEQSANTLQRRIQFAMIGLVMVSLLIVGLITLFFFQNQYNDYHNARLLRKLNTVIADLNAEIEYEDEEINTDLDFQKIIHGHINALVKIHNLDLNVFDRNGDLLATSQPDVFNKGLLSTKMEPLAYLNLEEKGKTRYVQDEYIGSLKFLSAYVPFQNEDKEVITYLNVPYYGEQQTLRADISYFIVALVNVYVLLILAAAMFAVLLSRSITTSLTVIRESLSKVKLGVKNVPISWKSNDEIGLLINEYNRMIAEIEDSANLLARSEREGAWREMAKQVAHEIKNPLTPMKLSIQHLERALKEDRDDIQELTSNITQRLIEQIDNLSHIATEFSSFAKMPLASREEVDLVQIIKSTAELFNDTDNITIQFDVPKTSCFVFADKNQLLRVLNNLLKNATQAIPDDRAGKIEIKLLEKGDTYQIEVKDNGVGIDYDKAEKVFEPNFTTKSSGTGLGLAMAKNIIEKSDGRIWFESKPGEGATFIIILPRIKGNSL